MAADANLLELQTSATAREERGRQLSVMSSLLVALSSRLSPALQKKYVQRKWLFLAKGNLSFSFTPDFPANGTLCLSKAVISRSK